jgi:signal transduction histidine kinase
MLASFLIQEFRKTRSEKFQTEARIVRNEIEADRDVLDVLLSDLVYDPSEKKFLLNKSPGAEISFPSNRIQDFYNFRIYSLGPHYLKDLYWARDVLAKNKPYTIAISYEDTRHDTHRFVSSLFLILFFGLTFVFIAFPFLHHRTISLPLKSLLKTIRQIREGNLDRAEATPVLAPDEIGEITESFNEMILVIKIYQKTLELQIRERTRELENTLKELQDTQSHLLQSERMSTLGKIAASVAHEINNPLAAIRGSTHRLMELVPIESPLARELENLIEISESKNQPRRETVVDRMNQRKEMTNLLQEIGIDESEILADILDSSGVKILPQELVQDWKVKLKPSEKSKSVREFLQNTFLKNILKAVDRASKISFALKHYSYSGLPDTEQRVSVTEGIETVLVIYSSLIQNRIQIEREYRTHPEFKDTGLGLSIIREIVKRSGGEISAESRPGSTKFTITIPEKRKGGI